MLFKNTSSIFNYAVKLYDLPNNPARTAGNMGKEKSKEIEFWKKEEYLKFDEAIMDKDVSYHALEILYWCGLRLGELLKLTPNDFDFGKQTSKISKSYQSIKGEDLITSPKTEKSNRIVLMPNFLAEEMKDYITRFYGCKDDTKLFPISKSYLHHEMDRGCKDTGVKRIRIHGLRHPYVKPTTKNIFRKSRNPKPSNVMAWDSCFSTSELSYFTQISTVSFCASR